MYILTCVDHLVFNFRLTLWRNRTLEALGSADLGGAVSLLFVLVALSQTLDTCCLHGDKRYILIRYQMVLE